MNNFGGDWTQQKIEIVVSYAKAYLTVMKDRPYFKLLYFDGFAGSGNIYKDKDEAEDIDIIKGTALRVMEIEQPRIFDRYYFVEKDEKNKLELEGVLKNEFSGKRLFNVVNEDCNVKMKDMASFLKEKQNKNFKVLAFIDPYGMSVEWASIEALSGLGVDMWILVPTGMGVNRLLTKNMQITTAWMKRLIDFLGMSEQEIKDYFYKEETIYTLFGEEKKIKKDEDAINKAALLYQKRLNQVFQHVSDTFQMKNSSNSVMYHFMLATNNGTALKIANDIIKPNFKS